MKNTMKNTMKILKFFVDQISFGVSGQPLAFLFQLIRIRDTFTYKWVNIQVMWLLALLILLHNILYIGVSGLDLSNYISSAFSISTIVRDASDPKIKNQKDEDETITKNSESSESLKTPIYPNTPVKVYDNAKESKIDMARDFKNKTIIYMWFNKITGKVYIGSGLNGSSRLSRYFFPSVLKSSNSRIYKNILKYGHDSFSLSVLEVVGESNSVSKTHYLAREQFYLDWALKTYGLLVLNLLPETASSLGFKHSLETKLLLSKISAVRKHSELTRQKLSQMFSGEANPFWGKRHKPEFIAKLKQRKGEANPMFNKDKSPEFIAQMYRDKSGANNPMYDKPKSEETLTKLRKMIYVYSVLDHKLVGIYPTVECTRTFQIGYATLIKKINDGTVYRNKFLFTREPYNK